MRLHHVIRRFEQKEIIKDSVNEVIRSRIKAAQKSRDKIFGQNLLGDKALCGNVTNIREYYEKH